MERYAELIRRITAENIGKVIISGPGEKGEAQRLKKMAGEEAFAILFHRRSAAPALLHRVDMYVGGDTGMMHLAALAGTPVLPFGPTDHKVNGPYGLYTESSERI